MGLTYPHPCLPRLRSVKIEQGKVNDQANTLADLAKVSIGQDGGGAAGDPEGRVSHQRGWEPTMPHQFKFTINIPEARVHKPGTPGLSRH